MGWSMKDKYLKSDMQISGAIVTFNNDREMLKMVIHSFLQTNLRVKLYIVDNSPTDTIRSICTDSRIDYFFVNSNIGFGAGHNLIIRNQEKLGKYHIILNPDIVIPPLVLEELIKYYDQFPNIGILTPKVLNPDHSIQYLPKLLPVPLNLIIRFVPFITPLCKKKAMNYTLQQASYDDPMKIAVVSGCFMMVKSKILKNYLFDERYFMYFEDFDLSRRIGKDFDLVMYTKVHVYHDYGRGAHHSLFLFYTFIKSLWRYFNKWGWFFDKYRVNKNREILSQFNGK